MSRKGNPYDNAMAENFLFILKAECIYRQKIATIQETQLLIDDFIDFYSRKRIRIKTGQAPLSLRLSA